MHDDEFPVTVDGGDPGAGEKFFQPSGIIDEIGLAETKARDRATGQENLQAANYGFNFRKLRQRCPLVSVASRKQLESPQAFAVVLLENLSKLQSGKIAKTRTGPPEPPSSFIGAAMMNAPAGGSLLRFAMFST